MESYERMPHIDVPMTQPILSQPGVTTVLPTTVVQVTQVNDPLMPRGFPRPWSTELTACCDDMTICLCGVFNPCHECMVATEMNESCCVPICIPGSLISMRATIRGRHNIEGNLLSDCVCVAFCGSCTTCQLAREIQNIKAGKAQP